jgi:hypothetical protein
MELAEKYKPGYRKKYLVLDIEMREQTVYLK